MRIAHINTTALSGAGRMAIQLCRNLRQAGHKALFCYAREHAPRDVISYRIGNGVDTWRHLALSRLTDRSGFFSKRATQKLVRQLELFKPDLVHLHSLHGYYLHLPTLFEYLKKNDLPVIWSLHDCWAYTGHCAYYTTAQNAPPINAKRRRAEQHTIGCDRWQAGCGKCVLKKSYPAAWLRDQSARNWKEKRALFQGLSHMVLTAPSEWLRDEIKLSFLKNYPVYVLPGGLDLTVYQPCASSDYMHHAARSYGLDELNERKLVLSVAAVWDERKGLDDLIDLAEKLGPEYCVAAVGLDPHQIEDLPENTVMGIRPTGNTNDLCALYTSADVYVSASHEETFGMTLLEALACGTPVACYDATAMPEIITDEVGRKAPLGDVDALAEAVRELCQTPPDGKTCKNRAAEFDIIRRYAAYLRLYEKTYRFSPAYQSALAQAAGKSAQNDE
ncbi:MAG: glycosyltransferase [Clostridia bacterium]|nr:glycosyltransferase [Clostridia bacterium]